MLLMGQAIYLQREAECEWIFLCSSQAIRGSGACLLLVCLQLTTVMS